MIIPQATSQNWKNQEKKQTLPNICFSIKFMQLIHIINSNAYPFNVPLFYLEFCT